MATTKEMKAEYSQKGKRLDKLKKEVTRLLKSSSFKHIAEAAKLIFENEETIQRVNKLYEKLSMNGEIKERDHTVDKELFEQVKSGDIAAIACAVIDGGNIGTTDKDMWTPMHIAALNGHENIIEFLIRLEADITAKTGAGHTPLHVAVSHSQEKVAEVLCNRGANPFIANKEGWLPLDLAATEKLQQCMGKIEETFIKKNIEVPTEFLTDCPAILPRAIKKKYHDVLKDLMGLHDNGFDVGLDKKDDKGNTLLHLAARNNDHKALELLLSSNPYPFKKNSDQKYPIDLVKPGKAKDILETYEKKYVDRLLESSELVAKVGSDLLFYCAEKGYKESMEGLLYYARAGVLKVNLADENKNTPLHIAVKHEREEVAAMLLKGGAEMLVFNNDQLMPCDYIKGNPKLTRIFNNFERLWVNRILQQFSKS